MPLSNTLSPFGFVPICTRDGKPYNGSSNRYYIGSGDSTALFKGDPVQLAGSADAMGVPDITRATAGGGNFVCGVVVGFEADQAIPNKYRLASTARYILVADDPDLMFLIQEDAIGGALAATNISQNADFIAGSGSTYTGKSGFLLDSSTAATTATLQCKIHRVWDAPDNVPFSAYCKYLVSFNLHQMNRTTGI